ncbi:MAG TPA: hypothetical protein VMC04_24165 [Verrucomicrobiae bacterium]|jgi:hypothetical protein|nr:hypothetical protein [Verrucomicrobiae bacterium]
MTTRRAIVTPRRLAAVQRPPDRVFTVTRSVLKSLEWDIDKEDRDVGWIRTDSRRLDGDNLDASRTAVTVERRGYEEERILFVAKEEDLKTDDRSVEKRILDEIGRSL